MTAATRRKAISGPRRIARLLKWFVPLAIVGALVAVAFLPKAIEVDVGEVTRGEMMLTVDDDGETRVRERYTISAPLAGRLLRVTLDPGDAVTEGQTLAILDPGAPELLDPRARARADAAVKAAEASVASARTQFEGRGIEAAQLEKAFERNRLLHAKGNVSDAVFEQAESAYLAARHAETAARSAVDIAGFDLEQARAALRRFDEGGEGGEELEGEGGEGAGWHFVIRSPVAGRVLRVHEQSSRMLQPGEPIVEVGDPRALELRIDVLSQDAVAVVPGQKVLVEHWGGDRTLEARVRLVEPSAYTKVSALGVDEQRVDVIADFETPAGDGVSLGDGYRVEARIVIWETKDALRVPAGALFRQDGKWAVFVMDGDRARLREIEIGRMNSDSGEVLSGLDASARVILHPGDRVTDQTLVKPRS